MNNYSLRIALTNTSLGHEINYDDFGLADENAVFKFIQIIKVTTGTLSIKFGSGDSWIDITSGMYPVTYDSMIVSSFWLKPSTALNVDIIASFIPTNYVVSS